MRPSVGVAAPAHALSGAEGARDRWAVLKAARADVGSVGAEAASHLRAARFDFCLDFLIPLVGIFFDSMPKPLRAFKSWAMCFLSTMQVLPITV